MFSRDLNKANRQILKKGEIRQLMNGQIEPLIFVLYDSLAVHLTPISASFERIVDYSADIAEVVINRGIKEEEA